MKPKNYTLFNKLTKILKEKIKENDGLGEDYNYFCVADDFILVWCKEACCLYSQSIPDTSHSYISEDELSASQKIQVWLFIFI